MNHSDIDFVNGSVNPSGIATIGYFIPKSDITSWPEIDDNPEEGTATAAGLVNYAGDFVLATGKKFSRIYSTFGKGKVTTEPSGEADSKMFINKATLSYPKINDNIRAFAKAAVNGDYAFIIKHDGGFYLIGHPDYPCVVAPSFDTGDAAGSSKGVTISLECPDTTPMPKYVGDIALSDGTLDCDTGTFTPTPSGS